MSDTSCIPSTKQSFKDELRLKRDKITCLRLHDLLTTELELKVEIEGKTQLFLSLQYFPTIVIDIPLKTEESTYVCLRCL